VLGQTGAKLGHVGITPGTQQSLDPGRVKVLNAKAFGEAIAQGEATISTTTSHGEATSQ